MMRLSILVLSLLLCFPSIIFPDSSVPSDQTQSTILEEGDRHWDLRAEGAEGGRADPREVDAAISAYREALKAEPQNLSLRWHLMRALHFKGEYATADREEKKRIFEEGRKIGEDSLELLRREAAKTAGKSMDDATALDLVPHLSQIPDAAEIFFWSSAHWGKWALIFGKLKAARQGAAGKIRDLAEAVIRIDPNLEEGGGYRVLGRLHHQTPYVPFITGWASTKKGADLLRQAVGVNKGNFLNRLYLAEALWDMESRYKNSAKMLAELIMRDAPHPEFRVEDQASQEKALELLKQWNGK
ncbi:MAG TPA: hypothetical protein VI702_01085 [Nitrospiria bacterium]